MIGRRRFISIIAGAGLGLAAGPTATAGQSYRWKGTALGAAAQIVLPRENAPDLVAMALDEVARLERIFSLYRRDSALSQLNVTGRLSDPPPELLELLGICRAVHRMTGGAFDPTIQPLWKLYAEVYSSGSRPSQNDIDKVLKSTGWDLLYFSAKEVSFRAPNCALSLNGIAQGYITDRVAQLLRAAGLSDVLVDMGEIVTLGRQPSGEPWRIAIQGTKGRQVLETSHQFTNGAVATSVPLGTTFDAAGLVGHILDPRTGRPVLATRSVTVTGPKAALADGLSTGLCMISESETHNIPPEYSIKRI